MLAYSEIFGSLQGEGELCGHMTIWLRLFGCNLKCEGFGRANPCDLSEPSPYKKVDFRKYERLEDLPVFPIGCDSYYSWEPNFKKFAKKATPEQMTDLLVKCGVESFGLDQLDTTKNKEKDANDLSYFPKNSKTGNYALLGITGGEPLLQQKGILELFECFEKKRIYFPSVIFETNGTVPLSDDFQQLAFENAFMFSISPKLKCVTGEVDGVRPDVLNSIINNNEFYLKFVVNGDPRCWDEIDAAIEKIEYKGGVWIMPMGATAEQQKGENIEKIVNEALRRGFNVSPRLQNYFWANAVGK